MSLLRVRPCPSFDSSGDIVNHWSLAPDSSRAVGSPIDLGAHPVYGTAGGGGGGSGVTFDPNGPSLKVRSGLKFDGIDYIQLSAFALPVGFSFIAAHSIFLWVTLANVTDIDNAGGYRQSFLGLTDSGGGSIRFGDENNNPVGGALFVTANFAPLDFSSTTAALASNRPCLVGYSFDGATVIFYASGLPLITQAGQGSLSSASANVLGSYLAPGGQITGSLADVRLYNRVVSGAEAYEMYASQFVPQLNMPELASVAAASFLPAWAQQANLPVLGTGSY